MQLVLENPASPARSGSKAEQWPAAVEFVISALEAGPRPLVERQKLPRRKYRARAWLRLFSEECAEPVLLYTRTVNVKAVGFLTDRPLPLSHGGTLTIPGPDGEPIEIACTVLRCRLAAPGWYEGALYFNREQEVFAPEVS